MISKVKVSVDLWGTLIKGSPLFKEEKLKLIQKYFPEVNIENIEVAFKETKKSFDHIIERTGFQPVYYDLWIMLFSYLLPNGRHRQVGMNTLRDIIKEYETLALKHIPTLYDQQTRDILSQLSDKFNLILSSNTLFLQGRVLKEILKQLDIYNYFTKLNFSDEVEVSKPHAMMYENSLYHIGDNLHTDCYGAKACGIKFFQVNSNDKTLKDALDYIEQQENR